MIAGLKECVRQLCKIQGPEHSDPLCISNLKSFL
jgi:hypothetical protein